MYSTTTVRELSESFEGRILALIQQTQDATDRKALEIPKTTGRGSSWTAPNWS
jgi:hypothetical protein